MKLAASQPPARDSEPTASGVPPLHAKKNAPRHRDLSDNSPRRRAVEEARRLALLVANSDDAIIGYTPEGNITDWNAAAERMYGYSVDEVRGKPASMLAPGDRQQEIPKIIERLKRAEACSRVETIGVRKDGVEFPVEIAVSPIRGPGGRIVGASTIGRDISERKRREEELSRLASVVSPIVDASAGHVKAGQDMAEMARQAQKMQTVGQLAGGVAHDFNNLLGVILGYTGLLLERLSPDDPQRNDIEQIQKAGDRAVLLTRQLLAFSRKQVLRPGVLDLNVVVRGTERLLERLIGEDIELVAKLAPDLARVKADSGQMEQIIMNLVVNARDAMPAGGRLEIETSNIEIDEEYAAQHPPTAPGRHVMLAVSDTGCGMNEETKAHIFEPFFTTKAFGKGTGLGLTTVYGIVQQAGGSVLVRTELGIGTTFEIYIPAAGAAVEVAPPSDAVEKISRGSQTILIVEDEAALLRVTQRSLAEAGYAILTAPGAAEAIDIAENHPGPIHLLMSDVILPGMSGVQLAQRLSAARPEMKVLHVSGYTDNHIVQHEVLEPGLPFLQKPFPPKILARTVSEVLANRLPIAEPARVKNQLS